MDINRELNPERFPSYDYVDSSIKESGLESEESHVTGGGDRDIIIKMHPFVRQGTVTDAFGRQSTFDLVDEEVLLTTDDKKRRQRLSKETLFTKIYFQMYSLP